MFGKTGDVRTGRYLGRAPFIYFGSESTRQIQEVATAFEMGARTGHGHRTLVLYPQQRFKIDRVWDYHTSADLTGQANHLGVTIRADIIKQKLPTNNGGYNATKSMARPPLVYSKLTTDHPIDLTRYQVANRYGTCRPDQQRRRKAKEYYRYGFKP